VLDPSVITNNFRFLIVQGFLGVGSFAGGTLRLAVPAIVLGFALGIFIGLARLARAPWIRGPATVYVEFFRGVPLVMVIFWMWFIVPIALRLIVPPATNDSLNLLKNSSVALTISVAELTFQARQVETYTAKAIEAFTAGTVIYLVLCLGIAAIMTRVERRFAIPGLIARGG